jgi:hypothetical protein
MAARESTSSSLSTSPSARQSLAQRPFFPLLAGAVALLLYLTVAWAALEPEAVWTIDTGAKWLQLDSLRWENGRLAFDIQYPNQDNDPAFLFAHNYRASSLLSVLDGRLHLRRLPLFPMLTLPFYCFLGAYGLYVLPALGGAAISLLTLSLIPRTERRLSIWLLVAFASPVFIYAVLFWEHTPAVAVAMSAVWWALRAPSHLRLDTAWQWAGVGALFGLAAYLRLETLIFSLTFLGVCWLLLPARRRGLVWAGLVLLLVMWLYRPLHANLFSQPVPENAAYVARPGDYTQRAGWRVLPDLLIGPAQEGAAETGWRGVVWAGTAVLAALLSFAPTTSALARRLGWGALAATAVLAAAFLFSPANYHAAHGLLFTTPWLLLAICRSRELWRRNRPRLRVIVLTTLLGLLGYALAIVFVRFGPPHGGLEWGPRFAIVFYPFLAIMAGWDLRWNKRNAPMLLAAGALIYLGVGFQLRGLAVLYQDKRINHELNQAIREDANDVILTDILWLPLNAAPLYNEKHIYLVDETNLSDWTTMAQANQITRFTLITIDASLSRRIAREMPDYTLVTQNARQFGHFLFFSLTLTPS